VAEDEARDREQDKAGKEGGLDTDPCRQEAAGQRGQQRPRRVGGGEHARPRLRKAELVRVVGQQGHDRRVERGVDQDHGGDEKEHTAHPSMLRRPVLPVPVPCGSFQRVDSGEEERDGGHDF
jgi:hypothetical protein